MSRISRRDLLEATSAGPLVTTTAPATSALPSGTFVLAPAAPTTIVTRMIEELAARG